MGLLINCKDFLLGVAKSIGVLGKIKLKYIFKYLLTIGLTLFVFWLFLFVNNKLFMENLAYYLQKHFSEVQINDVKSQDQRTKISPIIRQNHKELLIALKADRVLLQELHNGVTGAGGVGFKFINESYEQTNELKGIDYVALKYQNLNTSLLPICEKITSEGFFFGDLEEIKKIDPAFAQIMEEQKMYYVAFYSVVSKGKKIGYLNVYWAKNNNPNFDQNYKDIKYEMELTAHKKQGDADLLIYDPNAEESN